MIKFDPNVNSLFSHVNGEFSGSNASKTGKTGKGQSSVSDAVKAIEQYVSKVDSDQQASDMSVQDLLSGKHQDITNVVSSVAKADMSFKMLVGVRNKLIEAYKQTMNMPL